MILFYILITFVSAYSLFAFIPATVHLVWSLKYGPRGVNMRLNRIADRLGRPKLLAIEIISYAAMIAWIALVFPWIDLLWGQWFTTFKNDGMQTYFGWFSGDASDIYIPIAVANVVAARAAWVIAFFAAQFRAGQRLLHIAVIDGGRR